MYITQPLLVKSENYTLMSLEVQSTLAPVVASCGINTVLSLLKNLDWPTLQQENIYWLKQVLMELSASVSLDINIWRKTKYQESGTIKIHLKRQLENESSALSLNVRPNKLLQAANWLATNSLMFALA